MRSSRVRSFVASTSKIINQQSHRNQTEQEISKARRIKRQRDLSLLVLFERRKLGRDLNRNKSKKTIILTNSNRTLMIKMKRNQYLDTQNTKVMS